MAITEIQATLSSIKTAIDIGSFIVKSDSALDRALLKVKIEEIIDSLSEAKKTIRDLEDAAYEKDKLIKELQERIDSKGKTVGYLGARYYIGTNGEPTGTAYCPTCWAERKELIPLSAWSVNEATHKCGSCGNTVSSRMSPLDVGHHIKRNREASEKIKMPFDLVTHD